MLDVISLERPQRNWASSRLEGRNSWIFSSCGRCSRLTTGTSGTRSGGLRNGQSPCELLGGLSGFLSRRCRGLRSCVESVPEPEDSSPVLTWILGNFLSCSKGVKDLLEVPDVRCDFPGDASAEMGLISPGGENLLDFSSCGRCSRLTTGTSGTRYGGLRNGQSPCELLGGLSGFLSRRCRAYDLVWSRLRYLRIPLQC